jgi:CheY-like chemotaxis protein
LLRNYLELRGCEVLEAVSSDEVLDKLARERVDVMLSSLDLPGVDPLEMLRRIRTEPGLQRLRVVALASQADELTALPDSGAKFDDCQLKSDREGTLRSIEKLALALESRPAPVPQGR